MDLAEAARRLSVAEHEVVAVRPADNWWEALYHDMASHEETWRPVPGAGEQPESDPNPAPVLERDSGTEGLPESGSGEVPDGNRDVVLEWVGDDSDRAVAALEAEELRDQPRSTLVAALEKVVG